MNAPVTIVLKSGKDQSLRRRHPWVFSGAIKKIYGQPFDGAVVEVFDNKDEYLGSGHYQQGSIAVRILTFDREEIGEDFFHQRVKDALNLRMELGLASSLETNAFRLVNAEGDGLPGLIIDYYNGAAVIQMHSVGMMHHLDTITGALTDLKGISIHTIYDKSSHTLPGGRNTEDGDRCIKGEATEGEISEYGNRFRVNWMRGQKTGFFLDQRENRKLLEYYARDRRVLNMFCYSGGFSVYALRGGAKQVDSVDSSALAIDLARMNVELNFSGIAHHEAIAADAFKYFDEADRTYDLIVLDPPAFAKHQKALNNALQGYKRLNQRAITAIASGGIVFTFSCSQAVSKENFRKSVFAAAANAGRSVRVLHQLSQPADHPVSLFHPEGEYLKGLVLKVD
jgi:23S rRNA (cytosine1962-C5)-methyltransferase